MKISTLYAGASLLATLMCASPSLATTLNVTNVGVLFGDESASVDGQSNVYAAPLVFNGNLVEICITPFRNIGLGPSNWVYQSGVLNPSTSLAIVGASLDWTQINGMVKLADLELFHIANHASDDVIAGDQLALWSEETAPESGLSPGEQAEYTADFAYLSTQDLSGKVGYNILHDQDYVTQSVFGGAVPEPATWAMMLGGFALLGAGLRRRRTAAALSAA